MRDHPENTNPTQRRILDRNQVRRYQRRKLRAAITFILVPNRHAYAVRNILGMATTLAIRAFAGLCPRQLDTFSSITAGCTGFGSSGKSCPAARASDRSANVACPENSSTLHFGSRSIRVIASSTPFMPGISTSLTRMSGAMAAAISSAPAASYAVRVQKPARSKMTASVSATRCSSSTTSTIGSCTSSSLTTSSVETSEIGTTTDFSAGDMANTSSHTLPAPLAYGLTLWPTIKIFISCGLMDKIISCRDNESIVTLIFRLVRRLRHDNATVMSDGQHKTLGSGIHALRIRLPG